MRAHAVGAGFPRHVRVGLLRRGAFLGLLVAIIIAVRLHVPGLEGLVEVVPAALAALALVPSAVVPALVVTTTLTAGSRPTTRWVQQTCGSTAAVLAALALVLPAHAVLSDLAAGRRDVGLSPVDLLLPLAQSAPAVLVAAAIATVPAASGTGLLHRAARRRRELVALALSTAVAGTLLAAPAGAQAPPPPPPPEGGQVCPAGSRQITYDVAAFQLAIPLNGWGDTMPDGLMYGLKNANARVGKSQVVANPQLSQPITIRANVGDCVRIKLRNDIADRRIGIHPDGLMQFDPKTSDGAHVGGNPDTSLGRGEERTFTWYADHEGRAPVVDIANLDGAAEGSTTTQRGLFGSAIVHPKGSTWHDSVTGADLLDHGTGQVVQSEVFADVRVPDGPDHRSFVVNVMDEVEGVTDRTGKQPTFPTTGLPDSTFGINYRSEPLRNRLRAVLEHRGAPTPENPAGTPKPITLPNGRTYSPTDHFCDGFVPELGRVVEDPGAKCQSEESHLQSWVFGDEGKLTRPGVAGPPVVDTDLMIPKAYRGDPIDFAIIHPGARETHPWHQHTQRWFADPNNPSSPRKDVQSLGPGEAFLLRLEGGAGGAQNAVGDSVFHCHLYPHFAQGFWGHFRIYDRTRDGTRSNPDGTPLQALQELPDRAGDTPSPDADHPGFPLFVKGDVGQRAYKPPNTVLRDDFAAQRRPGDTTRAPNPVEAANMPASSPDKPGAGAIDPCPEGTPQRTYRPHAIDLPITYNKAGWHDRQGRLYVEESHLAAVQSGQEKPEPYTIRSRQGECVQLELTNDLHRDENPAVPLDHVNRLDGDYAQPEETSEISAHPHLVRFDQLASDGTSVGYNYAQTAMPGQTSGFRWFVDEPLRSVFFHDHQYPNLHQQKGLYASMNVEPPDAIWRDSRTGQPSDGTGTEAIIESPSGTDFREFTLYYADRAPMWRDMGRSRAIDPPNVPGDFGEDQGGYAINYRNEPFQIRTRPGDPGPRGDPAYVYSSTVHGDPSTPVLRAYPGDPVVIRNIAGSHEEMHNFTLHGHRWLNEPDNPASGFTDQQSLGLAEYFNYEIVGSRPVDENEQGAELKNEAETEKWNGGPAIVNGGAGAPGDYLYGSTALDDQWLGMWGIFRSFGNLQPDLAALPDRPPPAAGSPPPAPAPGSVPPPAAPINRCPSAAPQRAYEVNAIATPLRFNDKSGDHDPDGLMYVLAADEEAVRNGTKPPHPLVLRAAAGECVKITLTNKFPPEGPPESGNDIGLPADAPFPRGKRVSLHAGMTEYDVRTSDGSTVGHNPDQTVGPGGSITTYLYARPETANGTVTLSDFGDRRGNAHHGLFGALAIERPGTSWTDPVTGGIATGPAADVRWIENGVPRGTREFVAIWQDGVTLRDPSGTPIPEAAPPAEPGGEPEPPDGDEPDPAPDNPDDPVAGDGHFDPYERGNRGINYRVERFAPRLETNPEQASVFSSQVHGDPATPVFRAYPGDPVTMRFVHGADRGRTHTALVSGHGWRYLNSDPDASIRNAVGGLLPETEATLDLIGGAGGPHRSTGDFLIRDGLTSNQVNAGLWGLLRVEPGPRPDLAPLISPIQQRYASDQAMRDAVGTPVGPEQGTGTLRYQDYTHGRAYWTPETGVKEIHGRILAKFLQLGGHDRLGVPETDETATPDGTGRYNHFTGKASIYWTPSTDAHDVRGELRARWAALGWEKGPIGYPTTDEATTPDGTGRYNHFTKNASIYWTPTSGAHAIWGAIRDRWAALGWEKGPAGYPTTDETSTPDGTGRYNHFTKNASIYWTPTTRAHEVYGAIRDRWARLGWERSYLGYPVTGEFPVPGGRRSHFQRGFITFEFGTGRVIDRPY